MDDKQFYDEIAAKGNTPTLPHERLEQMTELALSQAQDKPQSENQSTPFLSRFILFPRAALALLVFAALSATIFYSLPPTSHQLNETAVLQDIQDYMTYSLLDDLL